MGLMQNIRSRWKYLLVAVVCCSGQTARANWTLNLGYHNPVNATVGLNVLYFATQWAFEAGLGWIDAKTEQTSDTSNGSTSKTKTNGGSIHAAGDIDVKYLFASGKMRPYLQAGIGVGLGAGAGSAAGFGASAGGFFGGIGLMLGSPDLYGYGSFNSDKDGNTFAQAGLGVDI